MRALIERIKQNIPEYRAYDEAATRNSIILPILSKLGWDIFSRDSVYPEYPVGSKRVDYSLRILGQNRFFIETKRCNVDLACHQKQLLEYAFLFGVELACLTNGITWQFFLPLKEREYEQRLFYTVDLENQNSDEIEKFFFNILYREAVESRNAVRVAEEIFVKKNKNTIIKNVFPAVWKDIITNPPQEILDVICDKIEKACGYRPDDATVARFLLKAQRGQAVPTTPTPVRGHIDVQTRSEQTGQRENPDLREENALPVEKVMLRGVEIPLERTGNDSKGYFKNVIQRLLEILTDKEIADLKNSEFCKDVFSSSYPLLVERMIRDKNNHPRSWTRPISGYYIYSQWTKTNLEKWKQYLLRLAEKG